MAAYLGLCTRSIMWRHYRTLSPHQRINLNPTPALESLDLGSQ